MLMIFHFQTFLSWWFHLQHTRIAVAFACWNLLLFLSLTIQLLVAVQLFVNNLSIAIYLPRVHTP